MKWSRKASVQPPHCDQKNLPPHLSHRCKEFSSERMLSPVTAELGDRILSVTPCCTVTDNRLGARQSLLRGTPSFRGGPPHCHSWHLCVDDRPAHLSLLSYLSLLFCFSSLKKRQDFPECFACLCFVMRNYQHLCCVSPASCEHHRSWLRSVGSGWLRLSDTLLN